MRFIIEKFWLVLLITYGFLPVLVHSKSPCLIDPTTIPPWPPQNYTERSNCLLPVRYPRYDQDFICLSPKTAGAQFNLANRTSCGTISSQDYYGFGVRVGFYFTWVGSFVANQFVPEEIPGAMDANSIFLFALEIAIAQGLKNDTFLKVDAVIMLLIGAGTTIGTMSLWGYRTCYYRREGRNALRHFGGWGTHMRLILCFMVNVFWLYFWYNPFSRQLGVKTCDPRCRTAYIFGRPISSGVHWLLFFLGLLSQTYWSVMLITAALIVPLARVQNRGGPVTTSKLVYKTGMTQQQLGATSYIFATLNAVWFVLVITLIEVTLRQNSVYGTLAGSSNTSSPAQLIPLLIGAATFLRITHIAVRNGRYQQCGQNHPSKSEEQHVFERLHAIEDDTSDHQHKAQQSVSEEEPKVATTSSWLSRLRQTAHRIWWLVLGVGSPGRNHECYERPEPDHDRFKGVSTWRRIIVTWLPWLGLLDGFLNEQSLADFLRERGHPLKQRSGGSRDHDVVAVRTSPTKGGPDSIDNTTAASRSW